MSPIPLRPDDLPLGQWSNAALRVLRERYLLKDTQGIPAESPEERLWRVAWAIAEADRAYGALEPELESLARRFYGLMVQRKFLPNSPTLMNAGRNPGLSLAACFVVPIEDSMASIVGAAASAALIQKAGGGTGFAFSRLRPRGSRVRSSSGISSGPVSFMRSLFDQMTEVVKQGSTRRGANMAVMRVDHPDILDFIDAKRDGGLTNFNLSVGITDEFMRALITGTPYPLRASAGWPRGDGGEYDEGDEYVDPATNARATCDAKAIWARITENAWRTGDPGLFFLDRANASTANPLPGEYVIESTNPCGEVPLYPNDQCVLGSINVAEFVDAPRGTFRWDDLGHTVELAVHFLDNVVDVSPAPTPEIWALTRDVRRIGLGIMGWADALARLTIPYASEQATELAVALMRFITGQAEASSIALAAERGPFPRWSASIYRDGPPRRNATVTAIAPTGTISLLAGCSSGIEPFYAVAFTHTVRHADGERRLHIFNDVLRETARTRGFWDAELEGRIAQAGTVRDCPGVPADVQRVFATAHEIPAEWHVRHQVAFQRHTHNSVSKTVNLARAASVEDVNAVYRMAWELGCLGITVFRDGCKEEQVITAGSQAAPPRRSSRRTESSMTQNRPDRLSGETFAIETPIGKAYITVTLLDDEPFELFVKIAKSGTDTMAMSEAIGRLASMILRLRSLPERTVRAREIARQLRHIGGSQDVGFGDSRVRSLPDAVALALQRVSQPTAGTPGAAETERRLGDLCPECGSATVIREEGCRHCVGCGVYAEC
jgi:ribonucleoside-diphosphate reductase alpha chain